MAHLVAIVQDPTRARKARVALLTKTYLRQGMRVHKAMELAEQEPIPGVGDMWGDTEAYGDDGKGCPLGRPRCDNCGDPAFKETCAAAGHCPQCGTQHGVGPASIFAERGLVLKKLEDDEAPGPDKVWDSESRSFKKRS